MAEPAHPLGECNFPRTVTPLSQSYRFANVVRHYRKDENPKRCGGKALAEPVAHYPGLRPSGHASLAFARQRPGVIVG